MVDLSYPAWIKRKLKEDGYYRHHNRLDDVIEYDRILAKDIENNGIKQPIRIMMKDNKIVSIDGCHRILIAKHLGIKEIPCRVIT